MKIGENPTTHKCGCNYVPIAQVKTKILDILTNKLLAALWKNEDTIGIEGSIIAEEALQLTSGLKLGYGVNLGYNTPDSLAYQLMEYNLFEFSASKTEARLAAMTDLLIDKNKKQIRSYPEFEKLASEKTKSFNKEWLQSEYNLSIAVGQNSAQFHRFMAEKDDFPFVEYQTAGDRKVRNQHAKLDGKIFSLSDKEAMKLWPPNGYGCRCEMLQTNRKPKEVTSGAIGQELMKEADPKWAQSQFDINRGDLKQVFTKEQFYSDLKQLPKKLNEMTYDKYDLKKWDLFKADLEPIKLDTSINEDNVKELFVKQKDSDFMRFKDYFGRKMVIKKATFDRHTIGKYLNKQENRHQLFPHVKDVLSNPDEVWYNNPSKNVNQKFQSKYIKFYQDKILIVDCAMTTTGLEIMTWYEAKQEDPYFRKGLLIRNKVK